jgi:asparagine synthase (glutamine-hydrolysing)
MCGVFAMLGPLGDDALAAVSSSLRHRGPDAEGRFADGRCTLLHRRLRVIDLSPGGAQPMANDDGRIQVVFNGEIYNHKELRRELEGRGAKFRSRSDTEAIVRGYEAWGDGVVEKLDGMFAFALWDVSRQRLLVARDRVGKKPLFYAFVDGKFVCASTVGALHAAGLPRAIDAAGLPHYLSWGFVPAPRTLHAGVAQMPPATMMVVEPGGADPTPREYWRAQFGVTRATRGSSAGATRDSFAGGTRDSFAEATRRVRELTIAAVERRLESDVPLGAFLSGGIDSTIVVGLMARALAGQKVRTFSIGFQGDARYDETAFARLASRAFDTEHTEFTLEPSSFALVETLVQHHDGPFGDSSAIPTYVVSQLTRKHVTVALTGDGGDELFCGYQRFLAAEAAERIPSPIRTLAAAVGERLPGAASDRQLVARARRFLSAASLPLADRLAAWNTFFDPRAILRDDLAATLPVDEPLAWQRRIVAEARGETTLARVLEHNFRTYLPYDLMVKSDRCSMAHALEARAPFLDTALVEYAATLPPSYLRRGRDTKRVLKQAFADLLPPQIMTRGKMGFGVPLGAWFRNDLREYLHDRLGDGARLWQWLDRRAGQAILDEHQRGARDHGQKLWLLLTLEVWLRQLAAGAQTSLAA